MRLSCQKLLRVMCSNCYNIYRRGAQAYLFQLDQRERQWRNDRPCYLCYAGGGILPNLLFFKRKIVLLGSKMDHISANLAFGRREKIFGVRKAPGGPIRKTEKKWQLFLLFSCGDSKNFVGAAKKSAGEHQMVTLRHI